MPTGSLSNTQDKQATIAEIDALVALLYGLSRSQVEHIFATFHRGWAYQESLAATLVFYDQWAASLAVEGDKS